MDVSKNSGTPKSSHFNRVFHYKPSVLGYIPLFLETAILVHGPLPKMPSKMSLKRWGRDLNPESGHLGKGQKTIVV